MVFGGTQCPSGNLTITGTNDTAGDLVARNGNLHRLNNVVSYPTTYFATLDAQWAIHWQGDIAAAAAMLVISIKC